VLIGSGSQQCSSNCYKMPARNPPPRIDLVDSTFSLESRYLSVIVWTHDPTQRSKNKKKTNLDQTQSNRNQPKPTNGNRLTQSTDNFARSRLRASSNGDLVMPWTLRRIGDRALLLYREHETGYRVTDRSDTDAVD